MPPSPVMSQWLWGAAAGLVAHLSILWWGLKRNHRRNEETLLPTLGYGNAITIFRGILTSLLAGFLFIPEPATVLAWLPALLYTIAAISDYFDGLVARLTNHSTMLGELLDMEFDGLGLLIAIGVAIRYGQLPFWYLLLGLGRQLFILGIWMRHRRGLSTFDLTPSENRRIIAGFQMGFISVILWPILTPPLTTMACILFSLPLAASFGRDWLVVSQQIRPESAAYAQMRGWGKWILEEGGALTCRVLGATICAVICWQVWPTFGEWTSLLSQLQPVAFQQFWRLLLMLSPISLFMLLTGVMSRLAALSLLPLVFSALLVIGEITVFNGALFASLVWVMHFGGGPFALWTPEETLLRKRAGDA